MNGPSALRGALMQQKEQFVKALTAKLLMYGVGREMHYYDAPAIRSILRVAVVDDFRWSSVVLAIVKSAPSRCGESHQTGRLMMQSQPEP